MSSQTTLWDTLSPTTPPSIAPIEEEQDRWSALLDEPMGLILNPLKYGPLTVDGYLQARHSPKLKDHASWPVDPAAIAELMVHCKIEPWQCGYVASDHTNLYGDRQDVAVATMLGLHLLLLRGTGTTPNREHLLDVLRDLNWGDDYYNEFLNGFHVMLTYLPTATDETLFLEDWLPVLNGSRNAYGTETSLGVALAATFLRAQPDAIITWCQKNDDQCGLGYLVWQDRFAFSDWLLEVAEPTSGVKSRSYATDITSHYAARRSEQLDTLRLLINRMPQQTLHAQGALFRQQHPEAIDYLLERTHKEPASGDAINWVTRLVQAGAVPVDHPGITAWLDRAAAQQEEQIQEMQAAARKVNNTRSAFWSAAHDTAGKVLGVCGEQTRQIIAQHMILHANPDDVFIYVAALQDREWLRDLPLSKALFARAKASTSNLADMMLAFYPYLPLTERPAVAEYMITHSARLGLSPTRACAMLCTLDPYRFSPLPETSTLHQEESTTRELGKFLYLLTQCDPVPFFTTLRALDINDKDPLFMEQISQWLKHAINTSVQPQVLPPSLDDTVVGY